MVGDSGIGSAVVDDEGRDRVGGLDGVGDAQIVGGIDRQGAQIDHRVPVETSPGIEKSVADLEVEVGFHLNQQVGRQHVGVGGEVGVLGRQRFGRP